jgi:hypothetical protein
MFLKSVKLYFFRKEQFMEESFRLKKLEKEVILTKHAFWPFVSLPFFTFYMDYQAVFFSKIVFIFKTFFYTRNPPIIN